MLHTLLAIVRMAARNVLRNRRRTVLSAVAIGLCVAFVWICVALTGGMLERTVDTATRGFLGHVQIHHPDYADDPRLEHTVPGSLVEALESAPGVPESLAVAPRVYGQAYARAGRLASGTMVLGIDPEREAASSGFADKLDSGRMLEVGDEGVLLGDGLAERLELAAGDELELAVSTLEQTPAMATVPVAGTVDTGIVELDDAAIFMAIGRAQQLIGLADRVHEIGVRGADPEAAAALASTLAPEVAGLDPDARVEPWRTISPDIALWVDMAAGTFAGVAFVIVMVVATAILLSQSMIVFERRNELGLLRAIGLRPRQLLLVLVVESSLVAAIGAILGLIVGGVCLAVLASTGLDLSGGTEMEMSGVAISSLVFPAVDLGVPVQAFVTTVVLAALASALAGLRTALRGPLGVMRDA